MYVMYLMTTCSISYITYSPATVTAPPGSTNPLLGRTQYRFGAVVFTLKHTFLLEGLDSRSSAVTTSVNGPKSTNQNVSLALFDSPRQNIV
jgi:hypothetical protein